MNAFTFALSNRSFAQPAAYLLVIGLVLALAAPVLASGAEVTRGEFRTYASGPGLGYGVSGQARMTRTADG